MTVECVINVSEGRDAAVIASLVRAGGQTVLDVHTDPHHHRTVLTLGGPDDAVDEAARSVVRLAVSAIDLRRHRGVHPRMGSADVVPFVPVDPGPVPPVQPSATSIRQACALRDRFARWAGDALGVPCFRYGTGTDRTLPEIRRLGFTALAPDTGPPAPHPTAGSSAIGARRVLIAYNLWLAPATGATAATGPCTPMDAARIIARRLREPAVRSLALEVAGQAQISCNLVDPSQTGVADVYDRVATWAQAVGLAVARAELVGLAPAWVVEATPVHRWAELDLSTQRTIEARLDSVGDTSRFRSPLTRQ